MSNINGQILKRGKFYVFHQHIKVTDNKKYQWRINRFDAA